jgi:hypothetical protein
VGTGTDLTGLELFFVVVPVAVVLFGWVGLVFWADAHPNVRHSGYRPAGYLHRSYSRTDDKSLADESSPAMSAADEEPAGASEEPAGDSEAAGARAASASETAGDSEEAAAQRPGPERR